MESPWVQWNQVWRQNASRIVVTIVTIAICFELLNVLIVAVIFAVVKSTSVIDRVNIRLVPVISV